MSELLIKGFKQLGTDNILTLDYSGITATEESAPIINDKPLVEDAETGKVTIQLTATDVGADPEGSAENALNAAKQYTDDEIAKIPTPDVSAQIGAHNTDSNAHESIRNSIIEVSNKVDTEVNNAIGAIQESISDISEDLDAHIADKNNPHVVTAPQIGAVPIARKINNKELSTDITLTAADVGALSLNGGTLNNSVIIKLKEEGASVRGLYSSKIDGTLMGGVCFSGQGEELTDIIIAIGDGTSVSHRDPAKGLKITKTDLLFQNKKVYHTGNKPTAADVGADAAGSASAAQTAAINTAASDATTKANNALAEAKTYTDGKISALVGAGGSETLDTIGEIAAAIEEHGDVINTLQPKITAGNGLTLSGTTLAVGAGTGISVAADAVGLAASGVTAGTYGPSAAVSGSNGATINVPQITVDTYGRVTSVTNRVYTSVDTNTTYSAATTSAAGLMSAADKTKLNGIATGANAYSLPTATSSVLGGVKIGSNITVSSGTISLTKANVTAALGYTPPTADTNTDTKVTQAYSTTSNSYPLLMTATAGISSTSSRGATTSILCNKIYANPSTGRLDASTVYGAVWNDYAEYREANTTEPGRVVCEYGDDTLRMATERLQPGASVVSDTFGFAIGETETAKTPIAVSGRVLVYPFEDRNTYQPGDAVCAASNGTVSKMSREEIMTYPERIIGTVSAIPTYETWGEANVFVNGRIWIKVK